MTSLAFTQLAEAHGPRWDEVTADERARAAAEAVVGASRFLTRLLLTDPQALAVLQALDTPVRSSKPHELLRIAARDLLGLDDLSAVGANLADLGDAVLAAAWEEAGAPSIAIIGMGKLGARELNYASDIDVLFVGDDQAGARRVMEIARQSFRVDADLRPEGRDGPLGRTLASYEAYWDRWAQPWEFQALLKARSVAGDPELGAAFERAAASRVWSRAFGADDLRELRSMKARAEGEVARRGLTDRELKRGRGGIRDIEFAVQLLQLVHGRHDPALRVPATVPALREMAGAGYVDPGDAAALQVAYTFLRTVEHRLQLVEDQQVHAVPVDAGVRTALARSLGYRDAPESSALARFDAALRTHQATARSIHERLYFRPLLEAFAGAGTGTLATAAAEERLAAFGFADADRTRQALRELTRGLTRSSRLMQQMLPLLLEWLSESPDPDLGLLGLRTLATDQQRSAPLVTAFRDSPEAARRLSHLLGTSRFFLTGFTRHPEMVPMLAAPATLAAHSRDELVERAAAALQWRDDVDERRRGLLRLRRSEILRTSVRDVLGIDEVEDTAGALTGLASAALEAALSILDPPVPMAVIAMGRFGGAELSYASDLDVLLVFDGSTAADVAGAEQVAEALLRFVNGTTPAQRIFTLDAGLRPEGRQGPLARSLESYRAYYERWARTWERQALVRARPVAGSPEVGAAFLGLVGEYVWGQPWREEDTREVRRMKARVERERIPAGEDPQFHLKLGRGSLSDVEWTAQLLQLQHGVRAAGTMEALAALESAGVLPAGDAEILREAYRFCERTRNRWFLVRGAAGPSDAMPTQADQLAKLARSLDTNGAALREHYRRVTRRSRQVVERVFYGAP
ncbi:MAG TPA: bifunctional [glutamine synthetase] adenylyltransferase/[glutamine synthetase]-adenylyl-L-tyrosine phosphorylase [Acidimicrobiales bacterium]|nr:bifunctional [glutamine synthetase] adenylyltransferase/[glutamine synthetase]-adenylyl-L-tyrosine phosphorylase [Acidimicrobiales bacterium]